MLREQMDALIKQSMLDKNVKEIIEKDEKNSNKTN